MSIFLDVLYDEFTVLIDAVALEHEELTYRMAYLNYMRGYSGSSTNPRITDVHTFSLIDIVGKLCDFILIVGKIDGCGPRECLVPDYVYIQQ